MARASLLGLALLALLASIMLSEQVEATCRVPPPERCEYQPKELCRETFTVTEVTEGGNSVGCSDKAGCAFGFRNKLVLGSGDDGKQIGNSQGSGVVLVADKCGSDVYITFSLKTCRGELMLQGVQVLRKDAKSELAVVGGTGIYTGASGVVKSVAVAADGPYIYNVTLTKPGRCYKHK